MDIAEALRAGDERELHQVWTIQGERRVWRGVLAKAREAGNTESQAVADRALADLAVVTALDALRANARLVELLIGREFQCELRSLPERGGPSPVAQQVCRNMSQKGFGLFDPPETARRHPQQSQERLIGELARKLAASSFPGELPHQRQRMLLVQLLQPNMLITIRVRRETRGRH